MLIDINVDDILCPDDDWTQNPDDFVVNYDDNPDWPVAKVGVDDIKALRMFSLSDAMIESPTIDNYYYFDSPVLTFKIKAPLSMARAVRQINCINCQLPGSAEPPAPVLSWSGTPIDVTQLVDWTIEVPQNTQCLIIIEHDNSYSLRRVYNDHDYAIGYAIETPDRQNIVNIVRFDFETVVAAIRLGRGKVVKDEHDVDVLDINEYGDYFGFSYVNVSSYSRYDDLYLPKSMNVIYLTPPPVNQYVFLSQF